MNERLGRVGGAVRVLHLAALPAAALCLLLGGWFLTRVWAAGAPPAQADWNRAADRIAGRIGPGEVIFVHPAGKSVQAAAPLAGLPVACDPWEGDLKLSGRPPAGIWVAGDRPLPARVKGILAGFSRKGTIGFGPVFLRHHWKKADSSRKKR